eukprot:36938-Pelagomonas_calceolata.AAC.1
MRYEHCICVWSTQLSALAGTTSRDLISSGAPMVSLRHLSAYAGTFNVALKGYALRTCVSELHFVVLTCAAEGRGARMPIPRYEQGKKHKGNVAAWQQRMDKGAAYTAELRAGQTVDSCRIHMGNRPAASRRAGDAWAKDVKSSFLKWAYCGVT